MKTRRMSVVDGHLQMFEIDNSWLSRRKVASLIASVPGVTEVTIGGSDRAPDARVRFVYQGREVIVEEPYGDNDVYWIGPLDEGGPIDLSQIERTFAKYRPLSVLTGVRSLMLKFTRRR